MADSADNPRHAALRGLEDSLRGNRDAQASRAAASTPPARTPPRAKASARMVAPEPDAEDDLFIEETLPPILRRRRIGLPAFLGGRVVRRVLVAFAALFVIAAVGVGALCYQLSKGPVALDFA